MEYIKSKLLNIQKFELLQHLQQLDIFNFPFFHLYNCLDKELNNRLRYLDIYRERNRGISDLFNLMYTQYSMDESDSINISPHTSIFSYYKNYILEKGIFNTLVLNNKTQPNFFYYNDKICKLIKIIVETNFADSIPSEWILPYVYSCNSRQAVVIINPISFDRSILYIKQDPRMHLNNGLNYLQGENLDPYFTLEESNESITYSISKIMSGEAIVKPIIPVDGVYKIKLQNGKEFVISSKLEDNKMYSWDDYR